MYKCIKKSHIPLYMTGLKRKCKLVPNLYFYFLGQLKDRQYKKKW